MCSASFLLNVLTQTTYYALKERVYFKLLIWLMVNVHLVLSETDSCMNLEHCLNVFMLISC